MTQAQKIIKYFAIAFAALLIVGILSGIYRGGAAIIALFEGEEQEYIGQMREVELDHDELPSNLSIDIGASELIIKAGDSLRLETNNNRMEYRISKGTLKINEKIRGKGDQRSIITLTLPADMILREADIDTGAGRILIESLSTNELSLDLSAGEAVIENLTVSGDAEINGGAGRLEIKSSEIGHIDLDHGIGELIITSLIKNGGELDCGVGSVVLSLIGSESDYSLNVEKGIGSIEIDGRNAENGRTYGTGPSRIEISGGVGSVEVDFDAKP